jgi:hypothetical protein
VFKVVCLFSVNSQFKQYVYSCTKETTSSLFGNAWCTEGMESIEPHSLFLRLLETICWDHTTLLDFVMSPETCFLLYLTRYLQYMLGSWNRWESACNRFHSADSPSKPRQPDEPTCGETTSGSCGKMRKRKITSQLDDGDRLRPELFGDAVPIRKVFVADCGIVVPADVNGGVSPELTNERKSEPSVRMLSDDDLYLDCGQQIPKSGGTDQSASSERSKGVLVHYSSSSDDGSALSDDGSGGSSYEGDESSRPQRDSSSSYEDENCSDAYVCKSSVLDDAMSVLIRFRLAIEKLVAKQLFPYNIRPLIRLLKHCERRYDTL